MWMSGFIGLRRLLEVVVVQTFLESEYVRFILLYSSQF
jgi:hypothetical protein